MCFKYVLSTSAKNLAGKIVPEMACIRPFCIEWEVKPEPVQSLGACRQYHGMYVVGLDRADETGPMSKSEWLHS